MHVRLHAVWISIDGVEAPVSGVDFGPRGKKDSVSAAVAVYTLAALRWSRDLAEHVDDFREPGSSSRSMPAMAATTGQACVPVMSLTTHHAHV